MSSCRVSARSETGQLHPSSTSTALYNIDHHFHRQPLPPRRTSNKMAAQNSAGIQTLLDAEREAQKIVQKENVRNTTTLNPDASAHGLSLPTNTSSFLPTDRTKRVKDARSEAQKEIEEYRNQKDEEFQQFESQHTSGNKKAEQDAEKETNEKLEEIKGIGKKTGPKVVEDLLKAVMDVQPQVPDRVDQPVA
ncbi:V-type proton ATPase subunit G [Cercospora zeina]